MARPRPALNASSLSAPMPAQAGVTQWLAGLAAIVAGVAAPIAHADEPPPIAFQTHSDRVEIRVNDRPFATYVFRDEKIPRPYFCNVHSPSGTLVTRPHPPGSDELDDHAQMHPGIWMAFGDLSGHDSWRLKAPVEHGEFVALPRAGQSGQGHFAVRNHYRTTDGDGVVADELCRFTIAVVPHATAIFWDSTFTPRGDDPIVFGDQEEMGLGVRLRKALTEQHGDGLLTNSEGLTTATNVWGQPARWCHYGGTVDGKQVGIAVISQSVGFRRSWWHARDYGLMVANPFGRQAMQQGAPSRVEIKPGESLRLEYAVLVGEEGPGSGMQAVPVLNPDRQMPVE
jgi:hypothetical protein